MSLTELVIRGLVADHNIACSECGARFRRSGLRVIRQNSLVWHISARCSRCGGTHLLIVRIDPNGMPAAKSSEDELSSELLPEEMAKLESLPSVSADDVLTVAQLLQQATTLQDFLALLDDSSQVPDPIDEE
ncbi:MAG: hypothetical protein M1118_05130 [Chloroflexi bacterium]|nr:hypothetical protein [Chloroflexota bacterium]